MPRTMFPVGGGPVDFPQPFSDRMFSAADLDVVAVRRNEDIDEALWHGSFCQIISQDHIIRSG